MHETQAGHGDAGRIEVTHLQSIQGLICRRVDTVGRFGSVSLGIATGKSRQGRVGHREAWTLLFHPEGSFDLLQNLRAFLELTLRPERGGGVEIPDQRILGFVGREVLGDGRGGLIIPFLDGDPDARTTVDIGRAADQAKHQDGEERTHREAPADYPAPHTSKGRSGQLEPAGA